jgi:hypothetical protein
MNCMTCEAVTSLKFVAIGIMRRRHRRNLEKNSSQCRATLSGEMIMAEAWHAERSRKIQHKYMPPSLLEIRGEAQLQAEERNNRRWKKR